jgi:4,5-dihydroxyphthalate decarboxylase
MRTKIFPIMHLVVIRRDAYEREPAIADKLYQAFVDAKKLALARMHRGHPFMLPWVHDDIHEVDEVFGGDPYPYGIEANRATLEALVGYMAEQHFIPRAMPIEDVFVSVNKALR